MSRRESCVWHPMPEEVRRSSIQSRRASLAAGRRASVAKDQPDWEVEAAPAQTRAIAEPAAAEATYPTEEPAAAEATYPTEEPVAAQREPTPIEEAEPVVMREPTPRQETPVEDAPVVEQAEPVQQQSREPVEEASHEPVEETQPAPKKPARAKTRHTIHFRGSKWDEVEANDAAALKAAFLEDIKDGAGVEADEAKSIIFEVKGTMTATFMMYHTKEDNSRMRTVHNKLQDYAFPKVCALYPPVSDDDEL